MQYKEFIKNRNFFLLWTSQTVSQFGDRLNQMALIGVVYEKMAASPLALANILALAIVPVFLLSPVAGVFVDRWDFRKTMLYSDLIRGLLILSIPFLMLSQKGLIGIFVIVFLSFCVGRFFIPAKLSIVPHLVPAENILMANSLISTTGMVAAVLGFGIGGVIVERWGASGAFIADAVTFFLSASLIAGIRDSEKKRFKAEDLLDLGKSIVATIKKSFTEELKEGIRYILASAQTKFVFKTLSGLFACLGALYVVFIVFIQNTLGSKTQDLGFLAVCLGVGLFVGSIVYGRIGLKLCLVRTINGALLASGVYLTFFSLTLKIFPHTLYAMVSTVLLGVIVAPVVIGGSSLIRQNSNQELWGRIFSSLEVVIHFFFLICMFLASFLAEVLSPFTIIVSVGIIISLLSLIGFIRYKDVVNSLSL